jgi:arylsulfatase A-like enzyme
VLFIALDDLNDWVGVLGGHPQAKTPNIDAFATKGVLFEEAYCAAPLCSPSRTAIMMGLRPSTTGIYGNKSWFRDIPKYEDWQTIPQYFRNYGYTAWAGGKIYHMPKGKFSDPIAWDNIYSETMGTPLPPEEKRYQHGLKELFSYNKILQRILDWGPIEASTEETEDWRTADLAADFLGQDHDKPFFLACGIMRPHNPWHAPQKYFDMHPIEDVQLPAYLESDLDDVPPVGRAMSGKTFNIIKENGEWRNVVQAYLASVSFADACVGRVLDALDQSQYRDNTIVVVFGDHGYHIGEKNHLTKSALWKETTRTPLIIRTPGAPMNQPSCKRVVSLLDLYPTLIELAGLPARNDLEGRSIVPLLRDPKREWPYPALITHSPSWFGVNHAVRDERYHYIRYQDGEEELYDIPEDPNSWTNLAHDPNHADAKNELKKWLPKTNAEHFTQVQ